MDYRSLVRKDLQALCKLNKIPANRTNVAMAEALSSLHIVKGIEKFCKSTESSVAESSVESPEKNVVTSPKTTRTGRRKQVREGSGVVQTVTPRKNRVSVGSVKTVQRVYNTRLSARLSKKEFVESGKKECVKAVKISSYCDGVPDNNCGEVSEDHNILRSDNVEVDSPIPEIEQQTQLFNWKNVEKNLDLEDTAETDKKSEVLRNNEAVVDMPNHERMGAVETGIHKKMADVEVDLCRSETDFVTEVLANEGFIEAELSFSENELQCESLQKGNGENLDAQVTASIVFDHVEVDFPLSEIEQRCASKNSIYADRDLTSMDADATHLNSKVLLNKAEKSQMDNVESVVDMPIYESKVEVNMLLHQMKDSDALNSSLSEIDTTTEAALTDEVELLRKNFEKIVVDMPTHETEAVTHILSLEKKGSVDVGLDFSFLELLTESSKRGDYKNLDTEVIGSTHVKGELINRSDDVGVDLFLSETEQQMESLNCKNDVKELDAKDTAVTFFTSEVPIDNKWSEHVEFPLSEIEQRCESQNSKYADRDLTLKDADATNLNIEVLINKAEKTQMDTVEAVVDMKSFDSKAEVDMLLHQMNDAEVLNSSLSEIDMTTEALANEVELLQKDFEKGVVDTPTHETKAVGQSLSLLKKDSDDVGGHISLSELSIESSKRGNDKNLCTEVIGSTNMKGESLNSSDDVGIDLFLSETEQTDSLNWKDDDKEFDAKDSAVTLLKSEVSIDKVEGFQVVSLKSIGEMPCHDNKAAEDVPLHKMKDDIVVDLFLPETDAKTEVLAQEVKLLLIGTETPVLETKAVGQVFSSQKKESDDVGVHYSFSEGSDSVGVHFSFSETDENVDATVTRSTESIESESLKEQLKVESSEKVNYDERVPDLMIQSNSEKIVFESVSSADNNFVDGENLDISMKTQQPFEAKSPSSLKLSGQICSSSAPPSLQSRRTKITYREPNQILADYPVTQKFISNYTPMPVSCTTTIRPNSKLASNVSVDKENIKLNERKVELTEEKAYNSGTARGKSKEASKDMKMNCI